MKCEDARVALDEMSETGLAPTKELGTHLGSCADCEAYSSFLEGLPARVAALPREIAPERDLWPGIERRIAGEPVVRFRDKRWGRPLVSPLWAVAAALLVAVVGGVLWTKLSNAPMPSSPVATGSIEATAVPVPASYETGAAEFTRATADLLSALDARKDSLTPGTRAVVEKNIAVIDNALREIETALAKDPENRDLLRLLRGMRKRKIETLQLVVKLSA